MEDVRIDVIISYHARPILILDTKYQQYEGITEEKHVAQVNLYSDATSVKDCAIVYAGQNQFSHSILKGNTILHTISIDLLDNNQLDNDSVEIKQTKFEDKCQNFINTVNSILEPLKLHSKINSSQLL